MTSAEEKTPGQAVEEWENLAAYRMPYHLSQYEKPKRSTIAFSEFTESQLAKSGEVIDLGCGAGASTAYISAQHPKTRFVGIDYSSQLIELANNQRPSQDGTNLRFEQGDWYSLNSRKDIDGVISLQTLSWLPDYQQPLEQIFTKLAPRWVAMSSLFYNGAVSCKIEVTEHLHGRTSFYNVYSLPVIDQFCHDFGYRLTRSAPFQIDIDLPKPANRDEMGSYTVAVPAEGGGSERLQISGPLLMNWHFALIEKQG